MVDVTGREAAVLARGVFQPGRYAANWDTRTDRGPVPAGLYFVRYEAGTVTKVARVVVTR